MAFFNGKFLNRAEIVNFAANKMGGTHNPIQAEIKKSDLCNYMEEFGLAALQNDVQIMSKTEFLKVEEYKREKRKIYDLYFLVTFDAAHRFAKGVRSIADALSKHI